MGRLSGACLETTSLTFLFFVQLQQTWTHTHIYTIAWKQQQSNLTKLDCQRQAPWTPLNRFGAKPPTQKRSLKYTSSWLYTDSLLLLQTKYLVLSTDLHNPQHPGFFRVLLRGRYFQNTSAQQRRLTLKVRGFVGTMSSKIRVICFSFRIFTKRSTRVAVLTEI